MSLSETNPKEYDKVIDNLIQILKKNGDLGKYEEVIQAYEKLDLEKNNIKEVTVTTTDSAKLNTPLIEKLNELIGQDIKLKHKVDESLIGGIMVQVDDLLIDGSVKRKLNNFKSSISKQ